MLIESLIFAILAMLLWGVGDFLIQRLTRRVGSVEALAWIGIIGSIGLLPLAWNDLSSILEPANLILIVGLGIITFFAGIFNFEALKQGKLSVVDVILQIELPITVILSIYLLSERLSSLQFACIIAIILGMVLISSQSIKSWKKDVEKGVLLALVAGLLMGFCNFMDAKAARDMSPFIAVWGSWLVFAILCMVVIIPRNGISNFLNEGSKFKSLVFFTGIIDTLAWVAYSFAVLQEEVSIMTAITESYPAFALFLGIWLNRERVVKHQYAGAALALGASFVLALVS